MKATFNNKSIRIDYFLHFVAYFTLAIFYLLWKANKYLHIKTHLLYSFLIGGFILAAGSEAIQSLIPGRTFNPYDFYANAAGIILGVIAPKMLFYKNRENLPNTCNRGIAIFTFTIFQVVLCYTKTFPFNYNFLTIRAVC
ncbi:MAG TPA: VanZ family protein, partial [Bacteroidales bacterium]|nr:VanZ family protein [Bacteroidales bacterium]